MVEAFARSLVDAIMLEAFNVVDDPSEKLQMLSDQQETDCPQPQVAQETVQVQNCMCVNRNKPEIMELIEKMVHGVHSLQIGDSIPVLFHHSELEKQVKYVVCSVNNASSADSCMAAETQGQGDMQQIIHDAIIETIRPLDFYLEKDTNNLNEATRVSTSLLHRLIAELEQNVEESDKKNQNECESLSKEKIAAWEETEEQFIRTIESVVEPTHNNVRSQTENLVGNNVCGFTHEEIMSSATTRPVLFTQSSCLEEITIEEIPSTPLSDQRIDGSSNISSKTNMKTFNVSEPEYKKSSVLGRTRKLLRAIFGRRKK